MKDILKYYKYTMFVVSQKINEITIKFYFIVDP